MKPTFTVVIPAYNAEETIEESLESVLAQDFEDYELIVVNDGSTDTTAAIIEAIAERNPQRTIHVLEQENQGLGGARNAGIAAAEGAYIALLDADDIWPGAKLSQCYEALQVMPECDVLYHPVQTFGMEEERKRGVYAPLSLEKLLEGPNPLVPSATVLRRELLREEPFTEEPRFHGAEDLHLWLRLLRRGAEFRAWPDALSYYRETGGLSTRLEDHLKHVFAVLDYGYEQGWYQQTLLEKARQRKFQEAARFYQKRGQRHLAERYYSAADSKSVKILGLRFLNMLGISW